MTLSNIAVSRFATKNIVREQVVQSIVNTAHSVPEGLNMSKHLQPVESPRSRVWLPPATLSRWGSLYNNVLCIILFKIGLGPI